MVIGPATESARMPSSSSDDGGYDDISHYCNGKESHWSLLPHVDVTARSGDSQSPHGAHLTKENNDANAFDATCVSTLLTKSQKLRSSPAGAKKRPSVPDKRHVFQNKENSEGKRSVASKKKKNDESKMLRQKLVRSEEQIASLQEEVDRRDDQLVESRNQICMKDKELEDVSEFVSSLQDLLEEMARGESTEQAAHCEGSQSPLRASSHELARAHPSYASGLENLDGSAVDGHQDVENAVQLKLTSKVALEIDVRELKGKIINLNESLACQENVIESLRGINMTSEQTISSLTQLIREKDQALVEMSRFSEMNDRANEKVMAHANKKHQEAMKRSEMIHEKEMTCLVEKNARLSESMFTQARSLDSLQSLNLDFEETIRSMAQLIHEKDRALAEISQYNAANDRANAKLLAHAQSKHAEELRVRELRIHRLREAITSQLWEKCVRRRELAAMKLKVDDLAEERAQYAEEVNFVLATLMVATLVMALACEMEWGLYLSPVYFLLLLCNNLD